MSFVPAIVDSLRHGYSKKDFISDLMAGIIIGIVSIPMALAFAIASGVAPEQGIYTSIVAGIVIGLLGGSRYQVSGATGAFVVVVLSVVQRYGYPGLAVATMMAGVASILLGLFKLGSLVKYMPYPVIIGFTTGIALVIFSTQIGNLLGITLQTPSESLFETYKQYFHHISEINFSAFALSLLTILITIVSTRTIRQIPGSLLAIFISTLIAYFFHLNVETIGSKFGNLSSTLPLPSFPTINLETIQRLLPAALSITILGAVESLLSATVADGMTKTKHNSNVELIGQGVGNFISPIFLGIPATGGIARTAANIKFGAKTPVASVIHALTIIVILLFFANIVSLIPLSALAGILVVVSWNMSEIPAFRKTLETTRMDVVVLVTTFLLTVLTNLTIAIEAGIIISALSLIQKISQTSTYILQKPEDLNLKFRDVILKKGIDIIELKGSLFFGSVDKFKEFIENILKEKNERKILIFDMKGINFIDASGLHSLEDIYDELKIRKIQLFFCHLNKQPFKAIHDSHLQKKLPKNSVQKSLDDIIEHLLHL